ncbi:hypothetical protein D8S78_23795 [Natrialba swarupiae]|nr:hypothetical protein [Natrialba swarupiae]
MVCWCDICLRKNSIKRLNRLRRRTRPVSSGDCVIKNLYQGDTREQAGRRVGISRSTTRRWALAWNDGGVEGLRPRFGGGRPPKLTTTVGRTL